MLQTSRLSCGRSRGTVREPNDKDKERGGTEGYNNPLDSEG